MKKIMPEMKHSDVWHVLQKLAAALEISCRVEGYLYEEHELESLIISAIQQRRIEREKLLKQRDNQTKTINVLRQKDLFKSE